MPVDDNSLPRLLELKLRIANCPKEQGQKDVRADLRIYRTEIEGPDDAVISVELKRATLEMELSGLETLPKTRFGEPVRENKIVEKQSTNVTTTVDGKVRSARRCRYRKAQSRDSKTLCGRDCAGESHLSAYFKTR